MSDLNVIVDTDEKPDYDPVTGTIVTKGGDGGVVVNLDARRKGADEDDFYANLSLKMDDSKLSKVASDLIDAIEADDRSRSASLSTHARALDLLGLELKQPKSSVGDSSAPVDGMSSIHNPLLLVAILRGWAN